MEFADVARELLLVAPADFVAERTARQRAVRKDDRDLAAAIGKLRKPAPAAWVVNLLAGQSALDDAVDLGPALREAQASADPSSIATLRRQRSEVVGALVRTGAGLAEDAGHPVTDAVLDQVRATIEAAMADPHAGAAVRSGLLVRSLESVGFDDVDLDGALADPDAVPDAWSGSDAPPIPITTARRGASRTSARATRDDRAREDRARDDRARDDRAQASHDDRAALREAETAARTASREADAALDRAESDLEDAEEHRRALDDRRRDLERELADLRSEQDTLEQRIADLEQTRDDAEAASDRARDELGAARRRRRDHR